MAESTIAFDPQTRAYVITDSGALAGATPTIQRAAILMLPLGALPAVPDQGTDIESIRRATVDQRQRACEDAVSRAWKSLVDENLIQIVSVTVDPSVPWNGCWYSSIVDLSTGKPASLVSS